MLLFAAITTWGVVPVSVYYINTDTAVEAGEFFLSRGLGVGRLHIYWNSAVLQLVPGPPRPPMRKTIFHEL
jgi:hypothetical protein